jgi:hypothetical protein
MSEEITHLPTDQYYIINQGSFAGRPKHEDLSTRPKKVYCPNDGQDLASALFLTSPSHSNRFKPLQFHIEHLKDDHYLISANGAPTKEIDHLLYALVAHKETADEWIITKRSTDGHRPLYT